LFILSFLVLASGVSGQEATPPPPPSPPDAQSIYEALVGEMAILQRDLPLSAKVYRDLAQRTKERTMVERALMLSRAAKEFDEALTLLPLWEECCHPNPSTLALTKADLLLGAGRIVELEEPLVVLLDGDPDLLEKNFQALAGLLEQVPDKKMLHALVTRLAGHYPDLASAQLLLAAAAEQIKQHEEARAAIARAQTLRPDWSPPFLARSSWALQAVYQGESIPDELAENIRLLEDFLTRQPRDQEIRLQLARLLIAAKDYKSARAHFDRLLADNPDNPALIYSVAMLALQEKDVDTARKLLTRILEIPQVGNQDMVRYFLGQTEEEAGNLEQARRYYQDVSADSNYYFPARRQIALLIARSDLPQARRFLHESVVRSVEEKALVAQIEAHLLREARLDEETYVVLAAALKDQPDNPGLLYDTALAADKIKRWAEMEQHLQRLIGMQPDNADAYNALGYSLADRNLRLPEAHSLIAKALEISPQSAHIMDSMGWVLYRQGKLADALIALRKAYERMADPEIAAHLGEVLWQLGQQDEALSVWQKEAEKAPEHEVLKETRQRFAP
jgi:tetratricopeptide (TPR) repeat protein